MRKCKAVKLAACLGFCSQLNSLYLLTPWRHTLPWPRYKMAVSGQHYAPAALPPGREPRCRENPDAKWIGTVYLLIKTWRNAYSPSCKTLCPANGIELFIDLNRGTSRQTIFTSIFEINYCRRLWVSAVTSSLGRVPFQRSTAQRLALHRFLLA